uniref:Uncharacterized protein n=1 Tax=Esox lucius TaxID=8010 RepID=A0A3P9ALG5_ESOLU
MRYQTGSFPPTESYLLYLPALAPRAPPARVLKWGVFPKPPGATETPPLRRRPGSSCGDWSSSPHNGRGSVVNKTPALVKCVSDILHILKARAFSRHLIAVFRQKQSVHTTATETVIMNLNFSMSQCRETLHNQTPSLFTHTTEIAYVRTH